MKKLIIIIQITAMVLLVFCGIYMYSNLNIEVTLINPAVTVPLWLLKVGSFTVGVACGIALSGIYILKQVKKFTALEKRNEKKEIKADNAETRIKVLENKIASLEAALEKALKK